MQHHGWKPFQGKMRCSRGKKGTQWKEFAHLRAPRVKHRIRRHLRHLLSTPLRSASVTSGSSAVQAGSEQVSPFIEKEHESTGNDETLEKCRHSSSYPTEATSFASVALLCQTRCHKRCRLANIGLPQLSHHK